MKHFAVFFSLFFASFTFAEQAGLNAYAGEVGEELQSEELQLKAIMQGHFPHRQVTAVDVVADGSLYQVHFASGLILYSLPGGQYFLAGNLFQAADGSVVDLTKQLKQQKNAQLLAALQPNEYLSLSLLEPSVGLPVEVQGELSSELPADLPSEQIPAKDVIYVFVDIGCYYCQFQHQESAALTAAGVEVRYLSYNRQKPGSSAYHKVRRTWCSNEPRAALDMMMQGRSLAEQSCTEGLMDKHIELAKAFGVKRLPAVVTSDGRLTEGLLRAPQIFNLLGIELPQEPAETLGLEVAESEVLP